MSRHERRDGLTTWIVRRQLDGSTIGTYEYVVAIYRSKDGVLSGAACGFVGNTTEQDALVVVGDDHAIVIAKFMNRANDGNHPWHAVRARP